MGRKRLPETFYMQAKRCCLPTASCHATFVLGLIPKFINNHLVILLIMTRVTSHHPPVTHPHTHTQERDSILHTLTADLLNTSADSDLSTRSQLYRTAHEHFQEEDTATTDSRISQRNTDTHNLDPRI